jgi:hypothetical protein
MKVFEKVCMRGFDDIIRLGFDENIGLGFRTLCIRLGFCLRVRV